jgi:hypothetical protein
MPWSLILQTLPNLRALRARISSLIQAGSLGTTSHDLGRFGNEKLPTSCASDLLPNSVSSGRDLQPPFCLATRTPALSYKSSFLIDKPQNIGYAPASIHYKLCLFIACKLLLAAYY